MQWLPNEDSLARTELKAAPEGVYYLVGFPSAPPLASEALRYKPGSCSGAAKAGPSTVAVPSKESASTTVVVPMSVVGVPSSTPLSDPKGKGPARPPVGDAGAAPMSVDDLPFGYGDPHIPEGMDWSAMETLTPSEEEWFNNDDAPWPASSKPQPNTPLWTEVVRKPSKKAKAKAQAARRRAPPGLTIAGGNFAVLGDDRQPPAP